MEEILDIFLKGLIVFSSCMIIICFVRAIIGPSVPDRLVAVNMIGTQIIIIIAVLTILLDEAWLADVASVYAMLSFLGVVVLTKIYIGIYRKEHSEKTDEKTIPDPDRKKKSGKKGRLKA